VLCFANLASTHGKNKQPHELAGRFDLDQIAFASFFPRPTAKSRTSAGGLTCLKEAQQLRGIPPEAGILVPTKNTAYAREIDTVGKSSGRGRANADDGKRVTERVTSRAGWQRHIISDGLADWLVNSFARVCWRANPISTETPDTHTTSQQPVMLRL
jgi:hypothetical protein